MSSLIIRQATEADLDACYDIEINTFPPVKAAAKETIHARLRLFPEGFLLAQLDGELIGMINSGLTDQDDFVGEELKAMKEHDPGGAHIVIFSLGVLPEYQGRGYARQLVGTLIEWAREQGKRKAFLMCKPELIAYYKSLGFVHLKKSASTHAGATWHEMGMSLSN